MDSVGAESGPIAPKVAGIHVCSSLRGVRTATALSPDPPMGFGGVGVA
jgi:hypothetical protein